MPAEQLTLAVECIHYDSRVVVEAVCRVRVTPTQVVLEDVVEVVSRSEGHSLVENPLVGGVKIRFSDGRIIGRSSGLRSWYYTPYWDHPSTSSRVSEAHANEKTRKTAKQHAELDRQRAEAQRHDRARVAQRSRDYRGAVLRDATYAAWREDPECLPEPLRELAEAYDLVFKAAERVT